MLRTLSSFGILFAVLLAFSCDRKSDGHHGDNHPTNDWKEMDVFHMVMADAFHPYKDSADLQPAKEKAPELAAAAREWKKSEIPEGLDEDKMESKLEKLTSLSEEFQKEVATGNDDEIGERLTELHDLFHELQNDFYGAGAEGHDKEHHDH